MLKKVKRYRAVIIGAGRIAAGFDVPGSKHVLTHAHAYHIHAKTDLVGIYDIIPAAATRAAKKWSTRAYGDLEQMLDEMKPDIISVCTPDNAHVTALLKIAAFKPAIVICEKPIAVSFPDAELVVKIFVQKRIPLLINQTLRFDVKMQEIQRGLQRGAYGPVISASAFYAKGILHNGIHVVDLARFLFGEVNEARVLFVRKDVPGQDKTVGGFLRLARCPQFFMMAGDERVTSIYEFDILCEKRRFRITDAGFVMSKQMVVADPLFTGYRMLSKPKTSATGLGNAMLTLVDHAVRNVERHTPLLCTASDALRSYSICAKLLAQSK